MIEYRMHHVHSAIAVQLFLPQQLKSLFAFHVSSVSTECRKVVWGTPREFAILDSGM